MQRRNRIKSAGTTEESYGKDISSDTEFVQRQERTPDQPKSRAGACLCEPGAGDSGYGKQDAGQEQQEVPVGENAHREFQLRGGVGGSCGGSGTRPRERGAGFRSRRKSPILVQGPDKDRPRWSRQDDRLLSTQGPAQNSEGSLFPGNHRE